MSGQEEDEKEGLEVDGDLNSASYNQLTAELMGQLNGRDGGVVSAESETDSFPSTARGSGNASDDDSDIELMYLKLRKNQAAIYDLAKGE